MIGQLQNNLRRTLLSLGLGAAMISTSAFAETVAGRIIYSDWYILVKDEGGVQTVMARGEPWPTGPRPVMVQFTIDEKAAGNNNLYIIAGSRPSDGLEPFLAFSLTSQKALQSGENAIEVFKSDYADINAPTNPVMIKEIIEGGMGGGTFGPSSPLIFGNPEKSLGTSTVPGIWAEGQEDNGRAVVFRLPYSALVTPPLIKPDVVKPATKTGLTFPVAINGLAGWFILAGGAALLGLGGLYFARRNKKTQIKPSQNKSSEKNSVFAPSFRVHTLKADGDSFTVVPKNYPQDMIDYNHDKDGFDDPDMPIGLVFKGSNLSPNEPINIKNVTTVEDAYHAVGRVGLAQDGPAIGEDRSYGTAILIDKDKVMTNRHVFNKVYKRILDKDDPFGIEFFGVKDSSDTEFYELTNKDVVIIEDYDAVILTLAKPVPALNRIPIKFSSKPPETYDDRPVLVIGYPAEPSSITDDIRRAFNDDLVFGVKRYSAGKHFRHPQDIDDIYGIEAHTSGRFSAKKTVFAICHNASTLAGSSGSAVICEESGELIGLHFGSDQFNRPPAEIASPANVAHSGVFLSKSVTFITSNAFENYLQSDSNTDGTT